MRIPFTPIAIAIAAISTASCAAPANEDKAATGAKAEDAAQSSNTVPAQATKVASIPFAYDEKVDTDKSHTEEAFQAAFNVVPTGTGDSSANVEIDDINTVFKPIALYRINEDKWVLLSGGQSDNEGHAASGTNAIHYLDAAEGGWQSTAQLFGFGSTGTFGNPATDWKFTRSLGKNPYLLTSAGGTWQGCTVTTTTLTELTPTGAIDRGDFIDHNSWGDSPSGDNFDHTGTIISAVPDKSFVVRYKGTKPTDVTFVRKGDKYVASGKVPAEGC